MKRLDRSPAIAATIALLAGAGVYVVATTVFAYHSVNHDEGVYLFQAAMLLEGQLEVHAGELSGAFRPWFFVEDGGRLYPKYAPVPAAMFALTMALFGEPRVTLAAIAGANAGLVYLLGTMTFDRRVGVVAAALFAASPLALVTTSAFLPYAPTTFLNLVFAVAYLRSVRDGSTLTAGIAGTAIGLAFFARPFTAVLFAAPFVVHATYRVVESVRDLESVRLSDPVHLHGTTALVGSLFVGLTLLYNLRMTGSPFLFPYEAFAPLDGPGFGRRRILGHSVEYTPAVALRTNGYVLWYLATRWFTAGPIGTALAVAGLAAAAHRWRKHRSVVGANRARARSFERTSGVLLAGLFLTVSAGNVLFWGNYNILGTQTDPTDGLLAQFGPFYHFDLLVPLSVFAGVAVVATWRVVPDVQTALETRTSERATKALLVVVIAASLLVTGVAGAAVLSSPLERNAAYAEKYGTAYAPIDAALSDDISFDDGPNEDSTGEDPANEDPSNGDDALVFVPTPYGHWQHHPFQYLRNDPGLDGRVVYALNRDPAGDFAVVDAYPDRTYYRFTYRGAWTPDPDRHVVPTLERLDVRRGASFDGETVVGVPDRVERARVRLETGSGTYARYAVDDPDESLAVPWSLAADGARLDGDGSDDPGRDGEAFGDPVPLGETDTVVLTVTLVEPDGSTLTYRQETAVRTSAGGVEVVWPPERYVCPLVTDCGNEGTYLPDDPDAHPDDVRFETRIE